MPQPREIPEEDPLHVLIRSFNSAVVPGLSDGEQVVCG